MEVLYESTGSNKRYRTIYVPLFLAHAPTSAHAMILPIAGVPSCDHLWQTAQYMRAYSEVCNPTHLLDGRHLQEFTKHEHAWCCQCLINEFHNCRSFGAFCQQDKLFQTFRTGQAPTVSHFTLTIRGISFLVSFIRHKMATRTCINRLRQDFMRLKKDPVPYVTATPLDSNILEWHYVVKGPEGTPYEGGSRGRREPGRLPYGRSG